MKNYYNELSNMFFENILLYNEAKFYTDVQYI